MNKTHLGLAAGLILAVSPIISRAQEAPKKKSRFAVAVNLVQVTEDNVGFGLNYEHFLNEQGSCHSATPCLPATATSTYQLTSAFIIPILTSMGLHMCHWTTNGRKIRGWPTYTPV